MRKVSPEKRRLIIEAADRLVEEGLERPTNDDVRNSMGGGSIADISPVMREWRESRENTSSKIEMPDSVKKAGENYVAQLWSTLNRLTVGLVENAQSECEERIHISESERNEAYNEITALEDRLGSLEQLIEERDRKIEEIAEEMRSSIERCHSLDIERQKAASYAEALEKNYQDVKAQLKDSLATNSGLQEKLIGIAQHQKN
jgi:chromosome segregation ATPase